MILALLLAQSVSVPAPPRRDPPPVADTSNLSLIVADTVSETDPQPLCRKPERCNSLYLARYENAVVLSGPAVDPSFAARVEMGSPWNMRYRIAMIVEHRSGREPLVRAMAGFGDRTHEACFPGRETDPLNWQPGGPRIVMRRRILCVRE